MFCGNCGKEVEPDKAFCTNCGTPVVKQDATPPAAPQQVGGPAATGRAKNPSLVVGVVFIAVILLAGLGVGLWLGLKGDDGAPGATTASLDAGGTTASIPGLEGGNEGTAATGAVDDPLIEYRIAVENMLRELDFADGRIPELANIINSTTPDVPQGVMDDLVSMQGLTETAYEALALVTPPAEFATANGYLVEAAERMLRRIQATIDGVQAGWDSGTSAARPYYSDGRHQRDAYEAAIQRFYDYVPQGTLPGD